MIYEAVDLKQVGYTGKTTTEFRRAAKSKAAIDQERRMREGQDVDTANDKVLEMLKKTYRDRVAAQD